MTEFEKQVLENQQTIMGILSAHGERLSRMEQRLTFIEKSTKPIGECLPKLTLMVNALHDDYIARNGLLAKEE